MSDKKIQQSGLSGMYLNPNDPNPLGREVPEETPRQRFNVQMQEARTELMGFQEYPSVDRAIFMSGHTAGVEMTLDVLKQNGYTLLDQYGSIVEQDVSLASGVWYTKDLPFNRETTEYQMRLQPGVNIKIDGRVAKLQIVHQLPNGRTEAHFSHGDSTLRYLVTGVGMPKNSHPAYISLSEIEILD